MDMDKCFKVASPLPESEPLPCFIIHESAPDKREHYESPFVPIPKDMNYFWLEANQINKKSENQQYKLKTL